MPLIARGWCTFPHFCENLFFLFLKKKKKKVSLVCGSGQKTELQSPTIIQHCHRSLRTHHSFHLGSPVVTMMDALMAVKQCCCSGHWPVTRRYAAVKSLLSVLGWSGLRSCYSLKRATVSLNKQSHMLLIEQK